MQKSIIDLDDISGKNLLTKELIRLIYKFAKSITKTNNKMHKPKTHNKAINNSFYKN